MDGPFSPLSDYGVVGNLETCALVGRDGSIDWCCLPYVYSPSVFAAILDPEEGGHYRIAPAGEYETDQSYLDGTNVLVTTFETDAGTAQVTDFMPVLDEDTTEEPRMRALYRKVNVTEGSVDLRVEFAPRFDYAREETKLERVNDGVLATGASRRLTLNSPVDLDADGDGEGDWSATFTRDAEDDPDWFVLQYSMRVPTSGEECDRLLEATVEYWRNWAHSCEESECAFGGVGHDEVVRSELVLKLLNYRETGALFAAPTTSLPEDPGGVRNWDYRYSWMRDGAMTVRALTNVGHDEAARDYVHRFVDRSREGDTAEVQPLYGVEGETDLEEVELEHLRGYRDSRPVRVGNEAAEQQQLDVYGDLVLAIYQHYWSHEELSGKDWRAVRDIAEYVCDHWDDRGAGIWELRGEPRHLVHSKVMCWAALDRAIDLAEREGLDAPLDDWRECRETIKETTIERGFDEEANTFTQSFEGDVLDATSLLIPLVGFLEPDDPRVEGTIDAIRERLATEEGLLYRYEDDGLPGEEGAFFLCSFWLVNALTMVGRTEEAWELFETLLGYTSPLGLLSEEVDPETGRLLGNFPQGFSHIGLINSALYLREAEYDWADVEPLGAPTLGQERAGD